MASGSRRMKRALYEGLTAVVKALANPHRLELLDLLAQAPRTVEVLAELSGLTVANASQHLQVLRAAGLVESEKSGSYVTYRLAGADVAHTVVQLRALAHARSATIARAAAELSLAPAGAEAVEREALWRRARRGEIVVVDVRPAEEYAAGHLPGALSVPLRELRARLAELPKDRPVVAYCRGPYCVLAADAVSLLLREGFTARRLPDGVAEWRAAGLPLETEAA